jgi:hypothetical protein
LLSVSIPSVTRSMPSIDENGGTTLDQCTMSTWIGDDRTDG